MKKLTILEALCVLKVGCSTSEERELVEIAFDTINDEVRKLRLIHKKDLIEKDCLSHQELMFCFVIYLICANGYKTLNFFFVSLLGSSILIPIAVI